MEEPIDAAHSEATATELDDSMPPGNHALEVAARAGFGPLSSRAQEVWHGQAVPCVSCGQLVHRDDPACEQCGQDLSEDMIRKMRQHAGPWFVLEHVRPFPGVSLERVVRQIRRGLITETSIVRGPSNDYQWRFAVETPGLCRYFGKCWCCHGAVTLSETYCPHCLHYLTFEKPRSTGIAPSLETPAVQALPSGVKSRTAPQAAFAGSPARALSPTAGPGSARPQTAPVPASELRAPSAGRQPESADLARLSAAVRQTRVSRGDSEWDQPPRVGGVNVSWIAALLIIGTVVGLLLISRARSGGPPPRNSASLPAMQPAPALPAPPAPSTSIPATPQSTSPSATTPAQGISPKTTDPPKAPDAIPPSGNP